MKMSTRTVENPKVVSREEWLVARKKLLAKEKQLTRQRDAIAAERRQLPWVKVEKNYAFDSPSGKKTLADLFDGRSQLIVYHFMFGPEWQEGCPSCSFNMDHTDGALVHLAQRDVSFAAVSRAPISKIEAFKTRMGWKFPWVSSYETKFNYDEGRAPTLLLVRFPARFVHGCPQAEADRGTLRAAGATSSNSSE